MDKEEREALEMTKDEVLARAARGKPARVARRMAFQAIMGVSIEELDSIVISGSTFESPWLRIPTNPTGIHISDCRFRMY